MAEPDFDEMTAEKPPVYRPRHARCTCAYVDSKYWTMHCGAVEPGSMMEFDPDCPVHGRS